MNKIISIFIFLCLTSCSREQEVQPKHIEASSTSTATLPHEEVSKSKDSNLTDHNTKAYFITVHVMKLNQPFNPKEHTGNVHYFYETSDADVALSFLRHWEKSPDMQIDYDQMKATSKSTALDYYIMKDVELVPADQAWIYREEK